MSGDDESRDGFGGNGGPTLNYKKGWVAVSRAMREHWLVGFGQPVRPADPTRGSLSRAEAWIDLIMECRYEAGTVINGGRKMTLRTGQLVGAVFWLAHRWNWSPKTVRGWLDKLEEDGMIERSSPGVDTEKGMQSGKQASVLTLCNYSDYQVVDESFVDPRRQANGTQGASKGHAEGNNIRITREQGNNGSSPPTPSGGAQQIDLEDAIESARAEGRAQLQAEINAAAEALKAKRSERGKRVASDTETKRANLEREATMAVEVYNRAAATHGYQACDSVPAARMSRLIKRLGDIGGLANFTRAVGAIPLDRFLSGQLPGRNGDAPFKLTIDRLLQDSGALGDVLTGLLEKSKSVADGTTEILSPDGKTKWGWWKGLEGRIRAKPIADWRKALATTKPNGQWPWWVFGPPPGSPDCLMPKELIEEFGFAAKYQGQIAAHSEV